MTSMNGPAEITFSDRIRTNVAFLEQRSRDAAQQEMDRSQTLDQKTAGLIAAALVLVAAGVAFARAISDIPRGLRRARAVGRDRRDRTGPAARVARLRDCCNTPAGLSSRHPYRRTRPLADVAGP